MLDQYGRNITYLRISITDRCNLRCKYCMPDEATDIGMKNVLTFEEIWEIVRAGVSIGITHVRITGYYIRLGEFYRQFQAIGNNYNQVVRAVQKNFGEK